MRNSGILVWLATLALASCGGGGNDPASSFANNTASSTSSAATSVTSVVVLSSLSSIPSDNSVPATITAYVRDANNQLLTGVSVAVSASSGSLAPVLQATGGTPGVTDASGTVRYTLTTPGDATNRTITITARAGAASGQAAVGVSTSAVTVLLLSDSPTIQSNNSTTAQMSAYVRDANNNFLSGVPVTMTTTTGALTPVVTTTGVAALTTDTNGLARATLSTPGDRTNRTITVTARVGNTTSVATVDVIGTKLTLAGPTSFILPQTQTFTATLQDSGNLGVAGVPVTITAPTNGTVNKTSGVTDSLGKVSFDVTATAGGAGTVKVTSLGLTATQDISVNPDVVAFTSPAANTNVALKTPQQYVVAWTRNGIAQVGQTVNFATTRGCVVPAGTPVGTTCTGRPTTAAVTTVAGGVANVYLLSDNAGAATVTASVTSANGSTTVASYTAQFVSVTPSVIDVQASKFTIGPNESSTITAVVRDAQNNLVAGSTVSFNLNDVTGGTLSTATAVTDTLGRAQTVFSSSNVPSANNGVKITATVQSAPTINKTVSLTVARTQLFISIGTGNKVIEPNTAQYKKDYVVQVTDANGAGVAGVALTMSVLSENYYKGCRSNRGGASGIICPAPLPGTTTSPPWSTIITATCPDEDFNRNGVLDPGEDNNSSGRIEAGNIVLVAPASITTDSNGFALVSIYYPQEYALYLEVTLQAQAQVQGTAFAASSTFVLPILATTLTDAATTPPGPVSPFGFGNFCTDTN